MGWIEKHAYLLVVILIIDENRILVLERKRESPVPAHSHGPTPLQVALERQGGDER